MKFDSLIFLALIAGSRANEDNTAKNNILASTDRVLYAGIESYKPKTSVTDHASFDLDLRLIRSELKKDRESAFRSAQRVYQDGAFSRPVAELILHNELEFSLSSGTEVIGTTYSSESSFTVAKGTVHKHAKKGDRVLEVLYDIRDDQGDNYTECQVGANPDPTIYGCFAEQGTIQIPDHEIALNYSYDVLQNNINYRSFQKESLYARNRLWDCENCPKPDYKKFVDYYGMYDYADHMIVRAFLGDATDMGRGNHDFRSYGWIGRREVVQNLIVWMTMWMEVISRMERSIDHCLDTDDVVDRAVKFWDSAVAFYTGSQVEDNSGYLLFHLANTRCLSASTCGEDGDGDNGTAWVNFQVLESFQRGQKHIVARDCEGARQAKVEIVRLMTIPLIQGALDHARLLDDGNDDHEEKRASSGAAFAASVLPLIHACSPDDAEIIHKNLQGREMSNVDFVDVRDAFARNLHCLGITCDEIGGVLDPYNDDICSTIQATSTTPQNNKENEDIVEEEGSSAASDVFMYAFITLSVLVVCFVGTKKLIRKDSEKEITFEGPASSCPPCAVNSIIRGTDYVPKHWQDCEKTEGEDSPNLSVDTGEMS